MPVRTHPLDRLITHSRLLELLRYNPDTGKFVWKVRRANKKANTEATGYIDRHGYCIMCVDGIDYQASRLAWFYVHACWPKGEIDHKNRIPLDNRIDNLRDAPRTLQRGNQKVRRDSKCGLKGVGWYAPYKKWRARCAQKFIGYYDTPEEAHAAYMEVARQKFGEFARSA